MSSSNEVETDYEKKMFVRACETKNQLIKCAICSKRTVFKCRGCGKVYYCSRQHQKIDWKRHQGMCKRISGKQCITGEELTKKVINKHIKDVGPEDCFVDAKQLQCYEELVEFVLRALTKTGLCVIDNYIHNNIAEGVMYETEAMHMTPGLFHPASVDPNEDHRSDEIAWIAGHEKLCQHIQILNKTFNNLISSLKLPEKGQGVPTHKSNIQLSCFSGKSFGYRSHVDNPADNGRLLTTVYHCNKYYDSELDGGISRYYFLSTKYVDIEPKFNRAVIHWSDKRIVHETLPSRRRLFALTSWYLDFSKHSAEGSKHSSRQSSPVSTPPKVVTRAAIPPLLSTSPPRITNKPVIVQPVQQYESIVSRKRKLLDEIDTCKRYVGNYKKMYRMWNQPPPHLVLSSVS